MPREPLQEASNLFDGCALPGRRAQRSTSPNWLNRNNGWYLALRSIGEADVVAVHLVRRSPDRALEQVADPGLQDIVGRQPDRVGDAAFANPEMYEFLEAEGMGYAIRLPANRVVQDKIGYLLKRPVGRPAA